MAFDTISKSVRACARVNTFLLLAAALFAVSGFGQTSYPVVLAPGASSSVYGNGGVWYSPNSSNASCTGTLSNWSNATFFNAGSDINLFRLQVEGVNTSPANPIICAGQNGFGFYNNGDNTTIHHYNFTIKLSDPTSNGANQRAFSVAIGGPLYGGNYVANVDPYAAVGQGQPLTLTYNNVAIRDYYFTVRLDAVYGRPLIAALIIEKVD
jgi:hypothetical protein